MPTYIRINVHFMDSQVSEKDNAQKNTSPKYEDYI
jgi:hypothetical protein